MTHNHSGYLFDSNIVIAILDNDHASVNLVRQAQEEQRRIFFSTITECEVLSGVKHNQFLIAERLFSPKAYDTCRFRCRKKSSFHAKRAKKQGTENKNS